MRILTLTIAALTVLVLAAPSMSESRSSVGAQKSTYGQILFDGRDFVLYAFTKDTRGRSSCDGKCAAAWPPYVVTRRPAAAKGATGALLGTTRRADGRLQATYAGRPLYYYIGDRQPGQILCQNVNEFGGVWLVVRPSGKVVR